MLGQVQAVTLQKYVVLLVRVMTLLVGVVQVIYNMLRMCP